MKSKRKCTNNKSIVIASLLFLQTKDVVIAQISGWRNSAFSLCVAIIVSKVNRFLTTATEIKKRLETVVSHIFCREEYTMLTNQMLFNRCLFISE